MAKYITVLDSDLNRPFWKAVQQSNTLGGIQSNPYYTAGVNMSLPKKNGDSQIGTKRITETTTGQTANATMIKLAPATVGLINLAGNNASIAFVNTIKKKLKQ